MYLKIGELAQLARALRLHRRGHRFDSDILHKIKIMNKRMKIVIALGIIISLLKLLFR